MKILILTDEDLDKNANLESILLNKMHFIAVKVSGIKTQDKYTVIKDTFGNKTNQLISFDSLMRVIKEYTYENIEESKK